MIGNTAKEKENSDRQHTLTPGNKRIHNWILGVVVIIACYFLAEAGVHIIDNTYEHGILGVKPGFESLRAHARENEIRWQEWTNDAFGSTQLYGKSTLTKQERIDKKWDKEADIKMLLFGDSVSHGHYVGKENSYVSYADQQLRPNGTQILNMAVDGYGLDQMVVKAIQAINWYAPDVVIIAYIPHDLLRVGSTFLYRLPKIKFSVENDVVSLSFAESVTSYYDRYSTAKRRFYLGPWALGTIWDNREYLLPNFHMEYYDQVFSALVGLIDSTVRGTDTRIVFLRLTNFTEFRGREKLTQLAERQFGGSERYNSVLGHYDTDRCTRQETEKQNIDWQKMFVFHPDRTGQKVLGECVTRLLQGILNLE